MTTPGPGLLCYTEDDCRDAWPDSARRLFLKFIKGMAVASIA